MRRARVLGNAAVMIGCDPGPATAPPRFRRVTCRDSPAFRSRAPCRRRTDTGPPLRQTFAGACRHRRERARSRSFPAPSDRPWAASWRTRRRSGVMAWLSSIATLPKTMVREPTCAAKHGVCESATSSGSGAPPPRSSGYGRARQYGQCVLCSPTHRRNAASVFSTCLSGFRSV